MNRFILHSILISVIIGYALPARADTTDNFQVYLRDYVALRGIDNRPGAPLQKWVMLDPADINDTIYIDYNHYTVENSERRIVIWNSEDEILLSRTFPGKSAGSFMKIPVKDIAAVYNLSANNVPAIMRYYDSQLPGEGVFVAYVLNERSGSSEQAQAGNTTRSVPGGTAVLEWAVVAGMILVMLIMIYRKLTKSKVQTARR